MARKREGYSIEPDPEQQGRKRVLSGTNAIVTDLTEEQALAVRRNLLRARRRGREEVFVAVVGEALKHTERTLARMTESAERTLATLQSATKK